MTRAILALAALAALAAPAAAQEGSAPKTRRVVVAPLSALGAEDTSASARRIQADLEQALATIEGTIVLDSKATLAEIKKAKRPDLRVCEGDLACLSDLGKLVGADLVVAGEAGGLGEITVVYLELVDVARARPVRSTTLELGDAASGGAAGAAHRLLAPDRYKGTLAVVVDAPGASIYVDGKRAGKSPREPFPVAVGTHALRVTHPEYRDFVRFVDVGFGAETRVDVALQQFPIVESELDASGRPRDPNRYLDRPAPWYRRWWAVAALSGIVLVASAATAGIIADGVDSDSVRPVGR